MQNISLGKVGLAVALAAGFFGGGLGLSGAVLFLIGIVVYVLA